MAHLQSVVTRFQVFQHAIFAALRQWAAVEAHRFDPVEAVFWRNRLLDFSTPRGLVRSLEMRPAHRYLMRPRAAAESPM